MLKMMMVVLMAMWFTTGSHADEVYECRLDDHTFTQSIPCPPGTEGHETESSEPAKSPQPPQSNTKEETCNNVSTLAHNVMKGRQTGMALSEMMKHSQGEDWIKELMIDAYDEPRYSTPEYQQRTITEFANTYYLRCFRNQL